VQRSLLDQVDHHRLEDAPALAGVITTGEGLARAFWRVLAPALPAGILRRVSVVETAKNRFEYRGEHG
jgi:6-pyruvoyl-tetrahydropterin synthase